VGHRLTQDAVMLSQYRCELLAQQVEQVGGAFDIGE
jgi:hypothetical protein